MTLLSHVKPERIISRSFQVQQFVTSVYDTMPRTKQKARRNRNMKQKQDRGQGQGQSQGQGQDQNDEDGKISQWKKQSGEWNQDFGVRGNYKLAVRENASFEKYYKNQNIVPPEEWDEFMEKLKKPLPSTFRIAGTMSEKREMLKIIKGSYLNNLLDVEVEGREIEPPKSLPWYPDEVAWQVNLDRKFIRQSDDLKRFHQFLVQETESGNISRQEAVSMIPPVVCDIQPHHKVLDMCAAPGSKTAQLIEMLHADESGGVPEGVVVANDRDNKRCYLMVHQVRRLQSPCFMVINHDAAMLPSFKVSTPDSDKPRSMKFDRILCDVPCSGDGTLRKNYDAWYKWNPAGGHSLHSLQMRILNRGVELLEVGGRLVYSTCSFNPVENEAVICAILQKAEGALELVDVSDNLPGLKFENGLYSWKIMSRDEQFFEKHSDVPKHLETQIRPSVFPPSLKKAEEMNLHRCMRVLPHRQDTGGFFVAVMEKRREVPWVHYRSWGDTDEGDAVDAGANGAEGTEDGEGSKGTAGTEDTEGAEGTEGAGRPGDKRKGQKGHGPASKRPKRQRGYKEDPFVFLTQDDEIWPGIQQFYDIDPKFNVNQVLVRTKEGKKRNLYFASKIIRELVTMNEERIRFINLGLKVLARSESRYVECDFRIVQDGLSTLSPYIRKRKVKFTKEDLVVILSQENPFLAKLTEHTKDTLEGLEQGGLVYVYEPDDNPDNPQCPIEICGWLGKVSCRSFLPRNERAHYLRLCGHELKSKDDVQAEKDAKKAKAAGMGQGEAGNEEEEQVLSNEDEEDLGIKGEDSDEEGGLQIDESQEGGGPAEAKQLPKEEPGRAPKQEPE